MPHLTIEYSPQLEAKTDLAAFCRKMHQVLVGSVDFPTAGIRVRAHKADFAVVADGHDDNDFLAMTLSVGDGRSQDQLRRIGDDLFAAGQAQLHDLLATGFFAFSLEIRVIDPELSWKDTPIHTRLSGQK